MKFCIKYCFLYIRFPLLFLCCLPSNPVLSRNYDFRHYTNESGLSHNTVYCSLQDRRGFLWFGTKDGLNRFDGLLFKVYRNKSGDETSIRNNYITCLYEDKEGLIWVGTNKGFCYYDPCSDSFVNIDAANLRGEVSDIKEDFKGNIWILSQSGLYKYDKESLSTKHYTLSNYPHYMCITQSGDIWVTANEGYLYKYDYQNDNFIEHEILNDKERIGYRGRCTITDAGMYGLLIGTEERGLKCFNPVSGVIEPALPLENTNNIFVRTVLKYSDNEYWIGSESGIHILNIKTKQIKNIRKNYYNPYSLGDNAVYTFIKDTEGGIWAGTYFSGVNYLPPEISPFEKIFDQGLPGDIKGQAIREICQDSNGNLWIGTEDNGLNKYDTKTKRFTNYTPSDGRSGLIGNNIHGLLLDGNKLWIGYFNSGIDIMDIQTGKVIKHYSAENKGINNNFIIKIYKSKEGEMLIGTLEGIYKYDPSADRFTFVEDLAPHTFIYCIYEDHNGTMWAGSLGAGLYYKTKDGKIGRFQQNGSDDSISSDAITDIFEDRNNRIWIGTRGNGLCEYNQATQKFVQYTTEKGFPSNFVYKILEDAKGNLWISTSNGLLCFNPDTKEIKTYSQSSGLTNNQFNYNSGYKDKFGRMYFGTINGMIAFNPEEIKENTFVPPVYITAFYVFNEEIRLVDNSSKNESILFAEKVVLPYNKSTFSIDFAALSYISPERNEYMYMLEGVDQGWAFLRSYSRAHYTNLSPGKYIFRVKAANSDGLWNQKDKTLEIVIKAPFWRTIWAYIVYTLIVALMVYFILKFYTQRLKLKNNFRLEKMEALKEKELFNAKIDFFTQIAHEIRTPLTLIKGSLDRIIKSENKVESINDNLPIMDKNTDRLLNLSNQLLDFRKTEKEGMRLNFMEFDIDELLRETYLRFTPVAEEKGIKFEYHTPQKDYIVVADKEAVTKILSNLFNNALKFAEKEVRIFLEINKDKPTFAVRVNNDGKIIPYEMKEKIFEPFFQYKETHNNTTSPKGAGIGLFLARSLSELHNGKLYLDKTVRDINSFVVELPKEQEVYITLNKKEKPHKNEIEKDDIESADSAGLPVVLIVEDEPDMLSFISEELSGNYHVYKAHNGEEALKIISKHTVNIIVSDISMPVMDGFELLKAIKSDIHHSHIPFILLSAKQAIQSKITGLELGADAYIGKPFSTDYLLAQIDNLLKNRIQLIESYNKSPFVYSSSIAPTKADEGFLDSLNNIIVEKLADPELSVEYLADTLGISTSSLYRKMKGVANTNPNEFIRIIRLKKAAELLLNENLSIKEVTYITGFSSPSYFTTSFFKQFGMKPSEFVKKNVKKK